MDNILIWGAGIKGGDVYREYQEFLKDSRRYQITAFVDSNPALRGKEKLGCTIIGPMDIGKVQNLAGIVIASIYEDEIREQLRKITDVRVFEQVEELMYTRMSIDISGFCNARCKWCITGRKNRTNKQVLRQYMSIDEFKHLYEHLYGKGLIEKSTEMMLYSWGEPFLNKDYVKIIEYLSEQRQTFSVSTNASSVQIVQKGNAYELCKSFAFSMPGFSQDSYDRIHGFSFKKIKENIELITKNIRAEGFSGDGNISYHVYKFSKNEITAAKKFADLLDLRFNAYYPYFNGNSMTEQFLEGRLSKEDCLESEQELFLSHVAELLKERPKDFRCILSDVISIDTDGNLVLCCASDEGVREYQWGSIYNIESYEQLRKKREEMLMCSSCQKCRNLGIDYWMAYNPSYTEE